MGASLGCAKKIAAPAAPNLPVGAVSSTDAEANQVLQAAHAFSARISGDILTGKFAATAAQKTVLSRLNMALNTADAAEQQYHACGVQTPSLEGCSAAALTAAMVTAENAFANTQQGFCREVS